MSITPNNIDNSKVFTVPDGEIAAAVRQAREAIFRPCFSARTPCCQRLSCVALTCGCKRLGIIGHSADDYYYGFLQ